MNRRYLLDFELRWKHNFLRRERIWQRKVPCLKLLRKAGDCFGWALGDFSTLFVKKLGRDAVKNNAEFGLGLEKVTIMRGAQGLAERILDPEFTKPCRMMVWVRKGYLRRFSNQRCLEGMVANQTEMCVRTELTNTTFQLTSGSRKDTRP